MTDETRKLMTEYVESYNHHKYACDMVKDGEDTLEKRKHVASSTEKTLSMVQNALMAAIKNDPDTKAVMIGRERTIRKVGYNNFNDDTLLPHIKRKRNYKAGKQKRV